MLEFQGLDLKKISKNVCLVLSGTSTTCLLIFNLCVGQTTRASCSEALGKNQTHVDELLGAHPKIPTLKHL